MNIYLDVDGVILANVKNLAEGAEEFIEYVVNNYPTYWLTTHCMDGDNNLVLQNVGKFCQSKTQELLKKIRPTSWKNAKTEAINFSQPFLWFDDDLYPDEREDLEKHNALSSWIKLDLAKNPHHLEFLLKNLKNT